MSECRDLDAFLDGTLDGTRSRAFEAHLPTCPGCEASVRRWRWVAAEAVAWSAQLPAAPPTPERARSLVHRAREGSAPRRHRAGLRAAAALAGVGLLAGLGWWWRASDSRAPGPSDRGTASRRVAVATDDPGLATPPGPPGHQVLAATRGPLASRWDRVRVALDAGAVAWVQRDPAAPIQIGLRTGRIAVAVDPHRPGPPVRLAAGPFAVTVVGTRFLVHWEGGTLRVGVAQGEVRVTTGQRPAQSVRAGMALRWTAGGEAVVEALDAADRQVLGRLLPNRPTPAPAPPADAVSPGGPTSPPASRTPPPGAAPSDREQGQSLLLEGRLSEAVSLLRRHVGQSPADAEAWSLLGDALRKAARPADAVDAYARVIALGGPRAGRARFLAATLLQDHLGQPARAGELLQAYLASGDATLQAEALWRLGRVQLAAGQRALARRTLARLVRDHGGSAVAGPARKLLHELEGSAGGRPRDE